MQHTRSLTLAERAAEPVSGPSRSVGNVAKRAHFSPAGVRWRGMTRAARLPRIVGAAVALIAVASLLSGCFGTADQESSFSMMNNDRAAHSVGPLIPHGGLLAKAQAWAEHLASINGLEHSSLPSGVSSCWETLGENVGYGSSISAVENAFMNSSPHRANLLNSSFAYAGTGVAYRGSRVFVVQVFMQGC